LVTAPSKLLPVRPELMVNVPEPVVVKVLSKSLLLPLIVVLPPIETAPTAWLLATRDVAPVPETVKVLEKVLVDPIVALPARETAPVKVLRLERVEADVEVEAVKVLLKVLRFMFVFMVMTPEDIVTAPVNVLHEPLTVNVPVVRPSVQLKRLSVVDDVQVAALGVVASAPAAWPPTCKAAPKDTLPVKILPSAIVDSVALVPATVKAPLKVFVLPIVTRLV